MVFDEYNVRLLIILNVFNEKIIFLIISWKKFQSILENRYLIEILHLK